MLTPSYHHALERCRFAIVFISNQAGPPKQQDAFKRKLPLLGKKLGVPFHAFAALSYDEVSWFVPQAPSRT